MLSFINLGDIAEIDLRGVQYLTNLTELYFVTWGVKSNISTSTLHALKNVPLEIFLFAYWFNDISISHFINKGVFAPLTQIGTLYTPFSALPAMDSLLSPFEHLVITAELTDVEVLNEQTFQTLTKCNVFLKQLTVHLVTLKRVEDHTCIWTFNLLILELDNNYINYLARGAFYGLNSLQKLTISHNSLAELPCDALHTGI